MNRVILAALKAESVQVDAWLNSKKASYEPGDVKPLPEHSFGKRTSFRLVLEWD